MDITTNTSQTTTELCYIMNFFGSDKGHPLNNGHHNYTRFYYELFKLVRNAPIRIFELGLGTNNISIPSNMGADGKPGASLRGWRAFFTNASVFGADIDDKILFKEDRIRTYYCDQGSPDSIRTLWANHELIENMDIIIEDGYHVFNYNVTFFENSFHKLKIGGIFIIEDIMHYTMEMWKGKLEEWEKKYPNMNFRFYSIYNEHNMSDNRLVIAQRCF
jgi:SAM-dependent methyltransferase